MKTANLIGATGLVGAQLLKLLLADSRFEKIRVFGRRSCGVKGEKIEEHIIDFDKPESWQGLVTGDVLFSTLGTTIKQAGSQAQQRKIDYSYQYHFAEAASANGVPFYVLVSAPGADPKSRIFYTQIKGELERDVRKMRFNGMALLRPGLLAGARKDVRSGEVMGYRLLKFFNALGMFKKYRPIHGRIVAQAMINAAIEAKPGAAVYTLDEVFALAGPPKG